MSNLKKILALVLVLVMSFSLVSVSSAATYADEDQIGAKYIEAVEVLSNMGIFKGDNGNFKPTAPITRQEVAVMMYRIISKDVADANDGLYVDACKFDDVTANWAKGYIGYCANGGYIKGDSGKFKPNDNISGTAVLAMILRAVGYDKNNEFTGLDWSKNVLAVATDLGILSNVDESVESLNKPASRQLVAELIFRAMVMAKKVSYTPAFSYQPVVTNYATGTTIGYDNFKLCSDEVDDTDVWGNPQFNWVIDYNNNGVGDAGDLVPGYIMGTFEYGSTQFTTAVKECEVGHALGYKVDAENPVAIVVNGQNAATIKVNAVDTRTNLGGQGRLTKVFDYVSRDDGKIYEKITMVDTFLAKVVDVTKVQKDNAGHIKAYAVLTLDVYDDGAATRLNVSKSTDWTYKTGDMVLVNAQTNGANEIGFEGNAVKVTSSMVLGLADGFVGAQTIIWNNLNKHTINGADYNDANTYNLNEAGVEITNHTWYKDTYGNVIGSSDVVTNYGYGVMTALWWANDGSNYGKGTAYTMIKYMDGTTTAEPVKVSFINGLPTSYQMNKAVGANQADGLYYVSTYNVNNEDLLALEMYKIETLADGSIALYETAELAPAKVQNKVSTITGTVSEVNNYEYNATTKAYDAVPVVATAPIHADNFTQYLTFNGIAFNAVTGIDNIASYTKTAAVVDYVDVDNDGWVDYVYILGNADTSNAYEFIYVTNNTYSSTLRTDVNGVKYYTMYGVVHTDGTTEPLNVLAANAATVQTQMANGVDQLFLVTKNAAGYVTAAQAVTNLGVTHPVTGAFAMYMGNGATYNSANGANGVLVVGGKYFNVNAATTLIVDEDRVGGLYTLAQEGLKNKYVYVISNAAQNIASAVFLSDKAITNVTPSPVDDAFAKLEAALAELKAALDAAKLTAGYTAAAENSAHAVAIERITKAVKAVAEARTALQTAISKLTAAEKAKVEVAQAELEAAIEVYVNASGVATTIVTNVQQKTAEAGVKTLTAELATATGDAKKALEVMCYELKTAVDAAGVTVTTTSEFDTAVTEGKKTAIAAAKATAAADLKVAAQAAMDKVCTANKDLLVYVTGVDTALTKAYETATAAKDDEKTTDVVEGTFTTALAGKNTIADIEKLIADTATEIANKVWNTVYGELGAAKKAACEELDAYVCTEKMTADQKATVASAVAAQKAKVIAATAEKFNEVVKAAKVALDETVLTINIAAIGNTVSVKVLTAGAVITSADVQAAAEKLLVAGSAKAELEEKTMTAKVTLTVGQTSTTYTVNVVKVVK